MRLRTYNRKTYKLLGWIRLKTEAEKERQRLKDEGKKRVMILKSGRKGGGYEIWYG